MTYICADSLVFFVEDKDAQVNKIYFTNFAGSSSGDIVVKRSAVLNLSMEENNVLAISVYPNPAANEIFLETESELSFRMYNVSGQIVKSGTTASRINVSDLPEGMYILQMNVNGSLQIERILVRP